MSRGNWSTKDVREAREIDVLRLENDVLPLWLQEQQSRFSEWVQEIGGVWDFSPESLDRLEAVVRERYKVQAEFRNQEAEPFLQVAAWYLGEVHNRYRGTQWQVHPDAKGRHRWKWYPFVIPAWDRVDDYEDEDGIDYDARPIVEPLNSLQAIVLEPYERPEPGQSLRDELDAYETKG
ncbi:hypothetical protein [Streptomyces luteolus]|uniref:Uncharacterized protein n=1 Tax=Streptomyces luteolus TaxID=3043615 RepID=A0ABT6SNW7_9ACTN|nr:hypothetical protein [Streptomyces sp. B-S-A12]MDI3417303.1 hypothetical protein [Streptomyces sp. B-S-A12]